MTELGDELLRRLARKYIWWKTPDESLAMPRRVMAQVMNIGDYDDVQTLANEVGEEAMRDVLVHAEAGEFNERSWAYWHYRLKMALPEEVPAMPRRKLG